MTDVPSSAPQDIPPDDGQPPLCRTVEDLWTAPARTALGRFAAPFLADSLATPLELLHSPRLVQAFEAHAVRRTFCDRVARAQASVHGVAVESRKEELEALITQAATHIQQRIKKAAPPVIPKGAYLGAATEQLSADDTGFSLDASITLTLTGCKTRAAKIDLLMDYCEAALADGAEITNRPLCHADAFLGEQIAIPDAVKDIARHAPSLGDRLGTIIDLYLSATPNGASLPPQLKRLQALLGRAPMTGCREGLIHTLQDDLQGDTPLIEPLADDLSGRKTLMADLMATADLVARLKLPDGFIGGRRTHDILDRRVGLMISSDKLREVLRGRAVLDKLRDLFHLQAALCAATSTKAIDDYILQIMDGRDFVARLHDGLEGIEPRLRALAELQELVLDAEAFPRGKRKTLAKQLDASQHDILRTTSILTALSKTGRPPMDAILRVVDLAGDKAFTRGHCLTEARDLIRRHVHHKDFVRKYLKSLSPEGGEEDSAMTQAADIGPRLSDLAARVRRAGIDFTDLSQLLVLIAEDEDSARSYIEMVLKDMGVGKVLTAYDGRAALDVFNDFKDGIDLIICDWKMPRISGLDVLKQIRSVHPKLPFLMVTALATLENVEEAMQHEVTAYIAKPFPPEQLEEKVLLLVNGGAPSQLEKPVS